MKKFIFTTLGVILVIFGGLALIVAMSENQTSQIIFQLGTVAVGLWLFYKGRNKPKPTTETTETIDTLDLVALAEQQPELMAETLETANQLISDQNAMIGHLTVSNSDNKAKVKFYESKYGKIPNWPNVD